VTVPAEHGPTADFFLSLPEHRDDPFLARMEGTLRFDVTDAEHVEHWYVVLDKGDVKVTHQRGKADAVVRMDRSLADAIFSGRENSTACLLRGTLHIEGELALMVQFQRLFPGPPESRDVAPAGYAERMR
jgi:hypothetical protein